ncbi:MAG: hypothetical protein ACXU8U_01055 [Asticcacaulis sp.]
MSQSRSGFLTKGVMVLSKPWFWWSVIAAVLCGFGVMMGFVFHTMPQPVGDDNCRIDGVIPAYTAVLIDQSDPFAFEDKTWLFKLVDKEASDLPKYGKFVVYKMDSSETSDIAPVFEKCSPGSITHLNAFTQNERETRDRWDRKFHSELEITIKKIAAGSTLDRSPILEKLIGIAGVYDFSHVSGPRRLVIISDMKQYSSNLTMYGGEHYTYQDVKRRGLQVARLSGVTVYVKVVHRKDQEVHPGVIKFWNTYFRAAGALPDFDDVPEEYYQAN